MLLGTLTPFIKGARSASLLLINSGAIYHFYKGAKILDLREKREERVMLKFTVPVYIEQDGDSFYAYSPVLKGLHIDGETENEACENVTKAVRVYINSLIAHGDPIPTGIEIKMGWKKIFTKFFPTSKLISKNVEIQIAA